MYVQYAIVGRQFNWIVLKLIAQLSALIIYAHSINITEWGQTLILTLRVCSAR